MIGKVYKTYSRLEKLRLGKIKNYFSIVFDKMTMNIYFIKLYLRRKSKL